MKILLATPSLLPDAGGPSYSVKSIEYNLKENSCLVTTLTRKERGGEYIAPLGRMKFIKGFDVVHNFGIWTPFNHSICAAANKAGVPHIYSPMGMLEPWALGQKKIKKQLGWLVYQRSDLESSAAIHVTSTLEAEHVMELGVRVPIAVIPHGMDIPARLPSRENREGITRTVLFLSRIHPKKGLLELVEAWSMLRPSGWKVVIAGPDAEGYGAVVSEVIAHHRLQDCISIVGPVFGENKSKLYYSADLFVLPTHSENFGLVIPEALSYGVPVITTTGAPWHELQDTNSGWWIQPTVPALVQVLEEAISMSSSQLRVMGLNGRQLVEKKYGWQAIIQKHIELYRLLAMGETRPSFILE